MLKNKNTFKKNTIGKKKVNIVKFKDKPKTIIEKKINKNNIKKFSIITGIVIIALFLFTIKFFNLFNFTFLEGGVQKTFQIYIDKVGHNLKDTKEKILSTINSDIKIVDPKKILTENEIKNQNGKVNVLILGMDDGGGGLTDTIIIASLDCEKNTVSLLSIPRDLYVKYPTGGSGKINAAFNYGEKKGTSGFETLQQILKDISGIDIDYYVYVDFSGFIEVVDKILGGIDIDVPNDILDTTYPGDNYSYETFRISKGLQKLNGNVALKYARSRHSTSDFDRSLRQHLIIKAMKEKATSLGIFNSVDKIKEFYEILKDATKSNFGLDQIIALSIILKDVKTEDIYSSNLNNECYSLSLNCAKGGFLYTPLMSQFNGQSVQLPYGASAGKLDVYEKLKKYSDVVLNSPLIYKEDFKISILNSTNIPNVAIALANDLKKYGFNIPDRSYLGNSRENNIEKTLIYYRTSTGSIIKPETVITLEKLGVGEGKGVEFLPNSDIIEEDKNENDTSGNNSTNSGTIENEKNNKKYKINETVDIEIVLGTDFSKVDI